MYTVKCYCNKHNVQHNLIRVNIIFIIFFGSTTSDGGIGRQSKQVSGGNIPFRKLELIPSDLEQLIKEKHRPQGRKQKELLS